MSIYQHSKFSKSKVTLKLVDSLDAFMAIKDPWNALYERSDKCGIFSSWDWMLTWWLVYQNQFKRELFILCLYRDEELVGIAPFQIVKNYPRLFILGKTLRFIGTGEARKDMIASQYLDFIVLPEMQSEMVEMVSEYLIENKSKWDFADFEYLLGDSLILKCFSSDDKTSSKKQPIFRQKKEYGVRFYVSEDNNFDQYLSGMKGRWRKMFNKKMRLATRQGDLKIETLSSNEDIEHELSRLAKMNCSRWGDSEERCIFKSSHFYNFHQEILKRLLPQKKALIKTLTLDGEALASYYTFEDKGKVHYYQSGFFPEYANKYSPLFLLICSEIKNTLEENKQFDFMFTDDVDSYKKNQYAAEYEKMYRLKWTPQWFRFYIYSCVKSIHIRMMYLVKLFKKY